MRIHQSGSFSRPIVAGTIRGSSNDCATSSAAARTSSSASASSSIGRLEQVGPELAHRVERAVARPAGERLREDDVAADHLAPVRDPEQDLEHRRARRGLARGHQRQQPVGERGPLPGGRARQRLDEQLLGRVADLRQLLDEQVDRALRRRAAPARASAFSRIACSGSRGQLLPAPRAPSASAARPPPAAPRKASRSSSRPGRARAATAPARAPASTGASSSARRAIACASPLPPDGERRRGAARCRACRCANSVAAAERTAASGLPWHSASTRSTVSGSASLRSSGSAASR